jgi:hypothetical protein
MSMLVTLPQWETSIAPAVAIETAEHQACTVYWGAIIPAIPNLIAIEQDRSGMTYETALQNLLQIQQRWLRQLHGDDRFTLSLRCIATGNPEAPIRLGLVGKTDGSQVSETVSAGRNFFNRVRDTLPNGYVLEPCQVSEDLAFLRLPFVPGMEGEVGEFRREVTSLQTITSSEMQGAAGCQIVPWAAETSNFQDLFRALTCHGRPVAISITLCSTRLTPEESRYVGTLVDSYARLASVGRNESEQLRMMSSSSSMQEKRLEAEQAAQIWQQFQGGLQTAFLCSIAVMSESPIPQSLEAALKAAVSGKSSLPAQQHSMGRGKIVVAKSEAQSIAVRQNWSDLTLHRWGDIHDLGRLPWLFGLEELHSVFRLPIADRSGTWGLPSASGATDMRRPVTAQVGSAEIQLGSLYLSKKQLTQHVLISGVPGSGKTNTSLYLLEHLWREHRIPWMVLEPAKTEYRGLQSVASLGDDLAIFSLGDERVAPFRFNPFELPEGINLDSHLGSLIDLFSVSMSMWGPLPNVVEQLVIESYKRKGFTVLGENRGLVPPTFSDVAALIPEIVPRLGYKKETTDEITAALMVRFNKFCRGAIGRMLNTPHSVPFDYLMQRPVILEMSQVTNTDDRAFLMGLILNRCYQYWTARRHEATGELKHLLLVEEAHNLLGQVSESAQEGQANPKGKAVRNFANMLAEVRGFGQGIAIAEQNPEGLVSDVMVNTNIKLAHRVVEAKNRESLGRSMLLTSQQEKGLAALGIGQMLYYIGGSPEASMTTVPNFKDAVENGFNPRWSDREISVRFDRLIRQQYESLYALPLGCPTEPERVVCLECGQDLVQALTEHPQYKLMKQDLWLLLLAAPFGAPARQRIFEVLSRILASRGVAHLDASQVEGVLESSLSILAMEAVQAKGQVHGWLGDQVSVGHRLVMRSVQEGLSGDLQREWLQLCQLPDSLLKLGLPHPEYGNCVAPGAFRYESQVLLKGDRHIFEAAMQDKEKTPAMALIYWAETTPLLKLLHDQLLVSFLTCIAIQLTEQEPDDLKYFLPT